MLIKIQGEVNLSEFYEGVCKVVFVLETDCLILFPDFAAYQPWFLYLEKWGWQVTVSTS